MFVNRSRARSTWPGHKGHQEGRFVFWLSDPAAEFQVTTPTRHELLTPTPRLTMRLSSVFALHGVPPNVHKADSLNGQANGQIG